MGYFSQFQCPVQLSYFLDIKVEEMFQSAKNRQIGLA